MTERRRVSSNSPYETIIGFSRAVRVGDTIYVSGTVVHDAAGLAEVPWRSLTAFLSDRNR